MFKNVLRGLSPGFNLRSARNSFKSGAALPRQQEIPDYSYKLCSAVSQNQIRSMSQWVVQWEKMRKRRPLPPRDVSAHYPDYVGLEDAEQLDSLDARRVSSDIVAKVNQQIQDHSHGRLFAVIQVAGKQFKVTSEDIITVQGYWAPQIGEKLRLEKVLLVGGTDFTVVGRPLVTKNLVRIEATVIEKTMSFTKLNFLLVPRQRKRKLHFHKTPYTMVRINSIEFDSLVDGNHISAKN